MVSVRRLLILGTLIGLIIAMAIVIMTLSIKTFHKRLA